MKKLKKSDLTVILVLTIVFVTIIIMNSRLIMKSMGNQTEQVGKTQINSIKTDFESYITNAEYSLIKVSSGAEQLMDENDDRASLEEFIIAQKKAQIEASNGVNFNVYIAGKGWEIIPDFDAPADYHATERKWYIGAVESKGEIYITEPYIDSMTGDMCFTMSVLLSDGETVVAMDFTLSEIQQSIEKMSLNEGSVAIITTEDGLIVGYSDMSYVGKKLDVDLYQYTLAFEHILNYPDEESFVQSIDDKRHTVFHAVTNNNWYMILCIDNSQLYREVIKQVSMNVLINVGMLALILFLYIFGIRNRAKAEEALYSRELFVEGIIEKLNTSPDMNEVRRDLNSYSSIVSDINDKKKKKRKESKNLSRSIRVFRNIIVGLLFGVMVISSYFFYDSGFEASADILKMESNNYANYLEKWENEQLTILRMFSSYISSDPSIIEDYDEAVEWLDSIAKDYPTISVCYLANPYNEHTVIMNNGWQPDEDWKVEERDWYKETEKSPEGYSISAPYVDAQTGEYCITISQMVYGKNGEFLGIFGLDLYMDKLMKIFGQNNIYGDYTFMIDPNGDIINHPNKDYQMSAGSKMNVKDTPYNEIFNGKNNQPTAFTDYDGSLRVGLLNRGDVTGFSLIFVTNWEYLYGLPIVYTIAYIILILIIIILIVVLINKVIRSQAEMNDKLSVAVKEAEAAGRAKSDFLAQMSHEIRTPINAVIGMDEMILRENKDPGIKEYALDIKSASKTLLTLINGILDFSKIESGKMDIVPVQYETSDMVDNLVNLISDRAEKKGLQLKLDIDENLPKYLYGDDVRIRQVITNLLTNAVKYTEKGSVTLTMRGEDINEKDCTLFVEVKDTGIGIKKEDMDKLFLSFQRIEERRNRTIEGTGLGMSIVDGILKLMDSSLNVSSVYGEGSSFSFRIVQGVTDITPMGEYQKHRELSDDTKSQNNLKLINARILVVDDNEMNLKVVSGLMKRMDAVPDLAGSGKKAIEMLKAGHYDIVLMDHMMPEMDGIETLREINKQSLIDDSTVVIALTANAISGAKEMYISEGFRDYLSKPIVPEELENMLAEYLPSGTYSYESSGSVGNTVTEAKNDVYSDTDNDTENTQDVNTYNIDEMLERLTEKGFNVKAALTYSMNDADFYKDLLETYVKSSAEKKSALKEFCEDKKWDDYRVQVHALKSASRTIGADSLADKAFVQEKASKAYEEKMIYEGFDEMMSEYSGVVEELKTILGMDDADIDSFSDKEDESDDMEVLEFLPEQEE